MINSPQETLDSILRATEIIQAKKPGFAPRLGLISGYNPVLIQRIQDPCTIDYAELPGFPKSTIEGHHAQLTLGWLADLPIICLQGRSHTYETLSYDPVKIYVRTLKQLGCDTFIATNASGSLRPEVGPGSLVLITDHIHFQPGNPLAGLHEKQWGPRFPAMDTAYHPQVNALIQEAAELIKAPLHQGVYISVLGPSYETAAEIRAFKQWGADVVGMSTVPEVLVANHCGMRVAVIACITNLATGFSPIAHSHEQVCNTAEENASKLTDLLEKISALLVDESI